MRCSWSLCCYTDSGACSRRGRSLFENVFSNSDTGFLMLDTGSELIRKQQIAAPNFFWFDPGVKRALDQTLTLPLRKNTYAYGRAFEHFIITETRRRASYLQNDFQDIAYPEP